MLSSVMRVSDDVAVRYGSKTLSSLVRGSDVVARCCLMATFPPDTSIALSLRKEATPMPSRLSGVTGNIKLAGEKMPRYDT